MISGSTLDRVESMRDDLLVTTTTNTHPATVPELLRHFADLDDLMVEAYGDHPALATVRATIAAEMDKTAAELRLHGVEIPEAF